MHIVKWDYIDPEAQKGLGALAKDGVEYLAEDDVAGSYMHAYSNTIKVRPYDGEKLLSPHLAETGKRFLVMRAGGLGDILFLTPAIHAFKTRHPQAEIYASSMGQSPMMLFNNPDISGFVPYPIRLDQAQDFDGIIAVEHMIEYSSAARTMHAVDLFAMAFGVELGPDEKQIRYFLNKDEREGAASFLPKRPRGKYRVGIQIVSNLPVRTYAQMPNVAKSLIARGHQVIAFGAPGQPLIQGAINTHGQDPPLNIRQSSTLIPECDVIIAPDSAITHLAGALDVPCIALYGSFLAKLRTAYSTKTKAIQAEGLCAPVLPPWADEQLPYVLPLQGEERVSGAGEHPHGHSGGPSPRLGGGVESMKTPEQLEALRHWCSKHPCWEIRCGGYVWFISAESALEAAKKWREVAKRPEGLEDKVLKIRQTSW